MESSEPQELPTAPLPVMRGAATANNGENPWKTLTTNFPVDAKTLRQARPIPGRKGVVQRSPFRFGEARLDGEGIHIQGQGTQQLVWLTIMGVVGYILFVGGRVIVQYIFRTHTATGIPVAFFVLVPVIGIIMKISAALIHEYRRVPHEFLISWDNVLELQIEKKMRWAVLVYQVHSGPKPELHSLPLTIGQPALVHALADTVEQYVPGKVAYNVHPYVWTLGRKIAFSVLILIVLSVMFTLLYAVNH